MFILCALDAVVCCVLFGIVAATYPLDVQQTTTGYQDPMKHLRVVREASADPHNHFGGFGGVPGFGVPGFGRPGFGSAGFFRPGFYNPGFGVPGFGSPGFGGVPFGGPVGGPVGGQFGGPNVGPVGGLSTVPVGTPVVAGAGVGGAGVLTPGVGGPVTGGAPSTSFSNSQASSFNTMIQTPFGGFSISSSNAFGGSSSFGG